MKIDWTQILISAAMTVMTAAVLGIFSKVSSLAETSASNQARLQRGEDDIKDIKSNMDRMAYTSDETRISVARLQATYDEMFRKMNQRFSRGG